MSPIRMYPFSIFFFQAVMAIDKVVAFPFYLILLDIPTTKMWHKNFLALFDLVQKPDLLILHLKKSRMHHCSQ